MHLSGPRKILTFDHDYIQTDQQSSDDDPAVGSQCAPTEAGDDLVYTIEKDRVTLSKAEVVPADDPFAVFAEWDSAADRRAYADL